MIPAHPGRIRFVRRCQYVKQELMKHDSMDVESLAKATGYTTSTVRNCLEELINGGSIDRYRVGYKYRYRHKNRRQTSLKI